MAKYFYNALKSNSQLVKGEVEAASPREARDKIRKLGYLPTKVYVETVSDIENSVVEKLPSENKNKKISFLSLSDKILFTSELEIMLASGIPILEALHSIEINTPKEKLRQIAGELNYCIVNANMTFAQALKAMYADVFGPAYISLCISGEAAGELEITLERLITLLKKEQAIKGKIISASIYPAILILIMFGVLLLFSKLIFPAFAGMMIGNGADVPLMASMLIGFCTFVSNFWWLVLIFIAGGSYAFKLLLQEPSVKKKVDNFLLDVPVLSEFIRYINLSNFMSVLQVSYDAGVPIMEGLELSSKTVGNVEIKEKVIETVSYIKQGRSLSEAFTATGVLPGALMTMITTGEKSGNLGKMLGDVVDIIDRKIDMVLETLTRLFEPALIVIMGIFVLIIAVAFYQLYFGMIGSIF